MFLGEIPVYFQSPLHSHCCFKGSIQLSSNPRQSHLFSHHSIINRIGYKKLLNILLSQCLDGVFFVDSVEVVDERLVFVNQWVRVLLSIHIKHVVFISEFFNQSRLHKRKYSIITCSRDGMSIVFLQQVWTLSQKDDGASRVVHRLAVFDKVLTVGLKKVLESMFVD